MPRISTHRVQLGKYAVRYRMAGEGEAVILVHGLSGSTYWWARNVDALAQHYRVYLVDLPGFGSMRRGRFVLTEAVSWLIAWMEAVDLPRAHLIGHSMGGHICLRVAAQRPEMVMSMILVSPAILTQAQTVLDYIKPLLLSMRYITPSFSLILTYDALRAGPLTLLRAVRDLLTQDVRNMLTSIHAPTLLIWGEGDTLVPPASGHIIRDEISGSRLLILKRAGHVSMYEQARQFNVAALAFLRGEVVGT